MLRRVVSHARQLGVEGEVLRPLVSVVVDGFGDAYPELVRESSVRRAGRSAPRRSASAPRCDKAWGSSSRRGSVPRAGRCAGDDVFKLSDTFGFPIGAHGRARDRSRPDGRRGGVPGADRGATCRARRAATKKIEVGLDAGAVPPTEFVGYAQPEAEATIGLLLDADHGAIDGAQEGDEVAAVPRAHPLLRGVRRTGRRRGRDQHPDGHRPGPRRAVGRPVLDHARRHRRPRGDPCRPGCDRRDRSPATRGDGPRAHVDPHRALDAEAHPR